MAECDCIKQINALRSVTDVDDEANSLFCGFKLANVTATLAVTIYRGILSIEHGRIRCSIAA